jgi:hypothetical protein
MIKPIDQPLSNVQMELLKLYSTSISDEHLLDLKKVISQFLLDKAIKEADNIWQLKGYNSDTTDKLLNKD